MIQKATQKPILPNGKQMDSGGGRSRAPNFSEPVRESGRKGDWSGGKPVRSWLLSPGRSARILAHGRSLRQGKSTGSLSTFSPSAEVPLFDIHEAKRFSGVIPPPPHYRLRDGPRRKREGGERDFLSSPHPAADARRFGKKAGKPVHLLLPDASRLSKGAASRLPPAAAQVEDAVKWSPTPLGSAPVGRLFSEVRKKQQGIKTSLRLRVRSLSS